MKVAFTQLFMCVSIVMCYLRRCVHTRERKESASLLALLNMAADL